MAKSARLTAAKTVAQRKALMVMKQRHEEEIKKIEAQLARPMDVSLKVPKEVVSVEAPNVIVEQAKVDVTVPEDAIQVEVTANAPTVNSPVTVHIPKDAIKVDVTVKSEPPILPPVSPTPITFSPKMPSLPAPAESSGPKKTTYILHRHESLNWITRIEAIDEET